MPIVPLEKRLDSIADGVSGAVEDYPGDPLDVARVLLCAAVETMVQRGLDQDQVRGLVSVVVDHDGLREHVKKLEPLELAGCGFELELNDATLIVRCNKQLSAESLKALIEGASAALRGTD